MALLNGLGLFGRRVTLLFRVVLFFLHLGGHVVLVLLLLRLVLRGEVFERHTVHREAEFPLRADGHAQDVSLALPAVSEVLRHRLRTDFDNLCPVFKNFLKTDEW
jgi:hypothetical protein